MNLESEMMMIFEDNIIAEIEKQYKRDPENWSVEFTYDRLLAEKEKKQAKMENPLKIENEDIVVYGDMPLNTFTTEDKVIIRNEGSQTAKKRTKNILIFNPDKYALIHLQVACNVMILNSGIFKDDATYTKNGKNIIFEFTRKELTFIKFRLQMIQMELPIFSKLPL